MSWPVEGVKGGSEISLTVDGLFGATTRLTGDYSSSELTVYWPDESGTLNAMLFQRSTISKYNDAVEVLRVQGADAAAWAEQADSEAQAIADADNDLASAVVQLERAIQGFSGARDWANLSVGGVQFALDSLSDSVSQLEETVASEPEFTQTDLDWVESEYEYLEEEASYALGAGGKGAIEDSLSEVSAAIREVESAIANVRYVEDLYLNSEFAPYDVSAEEALINRADNIISVSGPDAVRTHENTVQDLLDEGSELVEYARSLAG